MRLIKKYNNRCLYDTELSCNVSVSDIKKYVLDGVAFKIINAKTKEDITRQYLINVILELEALGAPVFSSRFLEQIIRLYSLPQQEWLHKAMEQTLSVISQQQAMFHNLWANTNE